ncbi:mariner Mos1 transposase [Trichonephila inaurata madagascariensis]|uniref:Mariner Mos1 transposase n=1 Tax=Trichonephila inaurata madagascariensis TaxID=2747483 RepID=A0A8X6IH97_9ARAC|nr:mariner Mos1 transposase [Trichonephila inaurata madagascariensis]
MCSFIFLQRYHSDGQHLIDHPLTRDETRLYHFLPTSKIATMEWKHPGPSKTKKCKVALSSGKVMATIFCNSYCVILINCLERGQTINADRYCDPLTRLLEAIRRKWPGRLSKDVIPLHDNVLSQTTQATQELLRRFRWKIWSHSHTAQIWYPVTISRPDFWGLLNPEWNLCSKGHRQSPVDVDPTKLLYDPFLRVIHVDKHRVSK